MRLDLRALAALRIAVGLLVLLDLALRSRDLQAFYTDQGVLPRETLLRIPHPTYFGLYLAAGTWLGVAFLMLLTAAAAVGLTLGWRTRWCALATWLLHIALKQRNPLILDAGDLELGLVLFWLMLLPCSARYSMEARANPDWSELPDPYTSPATLGYTLQIALIYLMAFLNKSDASWRENGLALYYCFSYDRFATGFGQALLAYPELLRGLTFVALYSELAIFILLVLPRPIFRWLACLLIALLHLSIAATLHLGLMPWIGLVGSLGLWPGRPFRWLGRLGLPPGARLGAPPAYRLRLPEKVLAVLVCLYVIHLNWALKHPQVVVPMPIKLFGYFTRQQQDWMLFAPAPGQDDGWYVARGDCQDGQSVDLLRAGRPLDLSKPASVAGLFPNQRWRLWLFNLSNRRDPLVYESFAAYLARRWNESHPFPQHLRQVELIYVAEPTPLPGQPLVSTPVSLYRYDCPVVPNQVLIP